MNNDLTAEELLSMNTEERKQLRAYAFYKESKGDDSYIKCWGCEDCFNCWNCSNCQHCEGCTGCTDCTSCWNCWNCEGCTDCTGCTGCNDCIGIINAERLRYVAYGIQLTRGQWGKLKEKMGK